MLEDKTCFITGGARGLGLGIARACAQRGARLALADIDAAALTAAERALADLTEVRTYALDITDRDAFLRVADQAEDDLGPVHALFNNAGVIDSVSPSAMRGELWDWMVDVNLNGVYNGVQAFVPRMIQRGEGGLVVNTSSGAGLVEAGSGFAYHATKYAVVGMSESLNRELKRHRIHVSVICPGPVATDIVRNTQGLRPDEAEPHTSTVTAILEHAHAHLRQDGVDADLAGERVVEQVLAGQLYAFTDEGFRAEIVARTESILACLPDLSNPVRALTGTGS